MIQFNCFRKSLQKRKKRRWKLCMKDLYNVPKLSPYAMVTSDENRNRRRRSRPRSACLAMQGHAEILDDQNLTNYVTSNDITTTDVNDVNKRSASHKSVIETFSQLQQADTEGLQRTHSAPETKTIRKLTIWSKIYSQRPFTAQCTDHEIRALKKCEGTQQNSLHGWALPSPDRDSLLIRNQHALPCNDAAAMRIAIKIGGGAPPLAVPRLPVPSIHSRAPRNTPSSAAAAPPHPSSRPQRAPFVAAARPRALSTEQRLAHIRELLRKSGGDSSGIDPLLFYDMGEEVSMASSHYPRAPS